MLELTNEEKIKLVNEGKTHIFNYRRVYDLLWCSGSRQYILRECERLRLSKYDGLPYTLRGRFVALDRVEAHKLLKIELINNV